MKLTKWVENLRVQGFSGYAVLLLCLLGAIASVSRSAVLYVPALLSFIALFFVLLRTRRFDLIGVSKGLPVYLFFAWMFLSSLWAFYPGATFLSASLALVYLWIFGLALIALHGSRFGWLHKLVTVTPILCFSVFLVIYLRFGSIRVTSNEMEDAVGSVANAYPALVLLCIPYLIYLFVQTGGERRMVFGASFAAAVGVITLSQSRGALLMLLVAVLLIGFLFRSSWSSRLVLTSKVAVATALVVLGTTLVFGSKDTVGPIAGRFTNSNLFSIFDARSVDGGKQENNRVGGKPQAAPNKAGDKFQVARNKPDRARTLMLLEGANLIHDHPLLGIGYNSMPRYMQNKYNFSLVSHNIVITAWGEMGVVGMALVLWIAGAAVCRSYKRRKVLLEAGLTGAHLYSATLVALIVGMLHAQLRPQLSNPLLYVVLAVALSGMHLATRRKEGNEANTMEIGQEGGQIPKV